MDLKSQVEEAFLYLVNYYNWFRPADEEIAVAVWCDALDDVPPEMLSDAVRRWCKENPKEPTAADIRKLILEEQCQQQKTKAEVIWSELVRAAEQGLDFKRLSQRFRNYPRVIKAVRSIGWDRVRYADKIKELPFVRKDFLHTYASIELTNEQPALEHEDAKKLLHQVEEALEAKKGLPQ